jgi:hypothetical protein
MVGWLNWGCSVAVLYTCLITLPCILGGCVSAVFMALMQKIYKLPSSPVSNEMIKQIELKSLKVGWLVTVLSALIVWSIRKVLLPPEVRMPILTEPAMPTLTEPAWKSWLRAGIAAVLGAPFVTLILLPFTAGIDTLIERRNLIIVWLLWVILTAAYGLWLLFRTGGKRPLVTSEKFKILLCFTTAILLGLIALTYKG